MTDHFDSFAMHLLEEEVAWSRCKRKQVACVVVNFEAHDWIAVHNQQPTKETECEGGPPGLCGCMHAERHPDLVGVLPGSVVYISVSPCLPCAHHLIHNGVIEVVYCELYRDERGVKALEDAGVKVRQYVEH